MANPNFRAASGIDRKPLDGANNARPPFSLADVKSLCRPLFLEGMKHNVVCNPAFEEFIARVRQLLLDLFSAGDERFPRDEYAVLASALSHYAFCTGFILEETEPEQQCISDLHRRIETTQTARNAAAIGIFACYRPLHSLANSEEIHETFKNTAILADVMQTQIANSVLLRRTTASIATLKPIADEVSLSVRQQYEEFPYPQWKMFSKELVVQAWQADEFCRKLEGPLLEGCTSILIAGCGTGRDAAIHAARFPHASITAVDVSRRSLAYATIKAQEHGFDKLAFLHGDILDLDILGQTFDYICCTGVLHHMEEPLAGWHVLVRLLRPGGLMRIGLYSRAGRKAVAKAQDAATSGFYSATRRRHSALSTGLSQPMRQ